MEDIEERVKKIIARHLGVDQEIIKPASSLKRDLGADSLDSIECLMGIEREFNIIITDDEGEKTKTFQNVIDLVKKKIIERYPPPK